MTPYVQDDPYVYRMTSMYTGWPLTLVQDDPYVPDDPYCMYRTTPMYVQDDLYLQDDPPYVHCTGWPLCTLYRMTYMYRMTPMHTVQDEFYVQDDPAGSDRWGGVDPDREQGSSLRHTWQDIQLLCLLPARQQRRLELVAPMCDNMALLSLL